jgi:hypothetical protein
MRAAALLALGLALPAAAAEPATMLAAAEPPTVFDLVLGTPAAALPAGFADFACGTRGGPPGRPVAGFADFAVCPADDRGLREVYFRYDDEREYVARALEQPRALERYGGTEVYGVPVIVSALFDAAGTLAGLRLESDPRGVGAGARNDHWALAAMLMHHYGDAGWTCHDLPPGPEETPVASYPVKAECLKSAEGAEYRVTREYLHRRGEGFTDDFGKVQATHFVSRTAFEVVAAP